MADDLARMLNRLGIDRTHLIGISMGGFIALRFALAYGQRVGKLTLLSTSPGGPAHIPAGPELDEVMKREEGEGVEERMKRILPFITGTRFTEEHREDAHRYVRIFAEKPMADEPYDRQIGAVMAYVRRGVADRLNEIEAPALVIHGTEDRVIPCGNGEYLADHLRNGRLSSYTGVGHLPPVEAPEAFNREVVGFLAG
jgi:pimeloyl-ACP methyl ester carboxylesterase